MPVTPQLVRFGLFELDLNTSELWKNGRKLNLQEQPARLLNLLLENPGEIVTRDKLKEALWSADTFVDFDHSLNAAVAKLRQALGDSAENPRFIETLARRGYRFIAPVEFVGNSVITPVQELGLDSLTTLTPVIQLEKKFSSVVSLAGRLLLVSILGGLALAAFALWLWHKEGRSETELVKLTEGTGLTTDPTVSADGKLLAYASDRGSGRNLNVWIQQLVPGGNAVQLTHGDVDESEPAFSPDGSKIVFRSEKDGGGLFVISAIGGEAIRLTSSGRNPRFSPDGRLVAYWLDASGTLYIIPAQGGEPRRVGSDLHAANNPVWSPDSKHLLAYVPPPEGYVWTDADWWLVSLDGESSKRTGAFSELRRQGFSLGLDRLPRLSQWTEHFITFAGAFGDATNSWRAPISDNGRITGRAERLTSGTTLEVSPTLTANGELIFASMNRDAAVWSLPADPDHAKVTGEVERITEGFAELVPSISSDGRKLAFTTVRKKTHTGVDLTGLSQEAAELRARTKDLRTGKESVISSANQMQWHPQISRDGSMVAYVVSKPGPIYAAPVTGGSPKVIVGGKNFLAWDWSLDNKRLLFSISYQRVYSIDLLSGSKKLFLSKPSFSLFQAKFSPDDQSVAVVGCQEGETSTGCQIFLVPLDRGVPVSPDLWIAISHPSRWDDKPRWSPSGKLLYFISDRDGYLCLWAQPVNSPARQLIGAPFPVYHFHNARLSMTNVGAPIVEIGVAKDRIVMGLGELTGNIWGLKRK